MIIYKTTNLINGKIYVGQDSCNNPKYYGSGVYLNNAIKKYGKENFKKEILEHCDSREQLNEQEKFWIKELKSRVEFGNYNLSDGGEGVVNLPEEIRLRRNENVSKAMTPELRKQISDTETGKYVPPEVGQKLSDSLTGRTLSPEHCQHISEVTRDLKHPQIKKVYQYDLNWRFIKEYECVKFASIENNLSLQNISAVCRCTRTQAGKYRWAFRLLRSQKEIDEYEFEMKSRVKRKIKPVTNEARMNMSVSHKKK